VNILNLSATNQTLVNGRPVLREWPLNNGDEIQLSADGPRLRFIGRRARRRWPLRPACNSLPGRPCGPTGTPCSAWRPCLGGTAAAAWLFYRVNADKDNLPANGPVD
jgi:hypothetical protein